jgi:hypothetical protein
VSLSSCSDGQDAAGGAVARAVTLTPRLCDTARPRGAYRALNVKGRYSLSARTEAKFPGLSGVQLAVQPDACVTHERYPVTTATSRRGSGWVPRSSASGGRYTAASCSSQAEPTAISRNGFAQVLGRALKAIATLSCIVPRVRNARVCHSLPLSRPHRATASVTAVSGRQMRRIRFQ